MSHCTSSCTARCLAYCPDVPCCPVLLTLPPALHLLPNATPAPPTPARNTCVYKSRPKEKVCLPNTNKQTSLPLWPTKHLYLASQHAHVHTHQLSTYQQTRKYAKQSSSLHINNTLLQSTTCTHTTLHTTYVHEGGAWQHNQHLQLLNCRPTFSTFVCHYLETLEAYHQHVTLCVLQANTKVTLFAPHATAKHSAL